MAGGLFSRIKVWVDFETFFNEDINGELDNVVNNLQADKLSGFSETTSQALTTLDPGIVGDQTLAQSIAEELQQLRFKIDQIIGEDTWIDSPDSTLKDITENLKSISNIRSSRVESGNTNINGQADYLRADATLNTVKLLAGGTDLVTFINGAEVVFTADLTFSSLTLAPSSNNTATANEPDASGGFETKVIGERNNPMLMTAPGTEITGRDDQLAAFKINNGADDDFFIARVNATDNSLENCFRGWFFDSFGLGLPRQTFSDGDTITLLRLTWVFATNNGGVKALDVTFNNPVVAPSAPAGAVSGDYWFDTVADVWKKFVGASFATQEAVYVGLCAQDTVKTIGARSEDFSKPFSDTNSFQLRLESSSKIASKPVNSQVSAYGTITNYSYSRPKIWDIAGVSVLESESTPEQASRTYYAYVDSSGGLHFSDQVPHDRTPTLSGEYHPHKPWRAVARIDNDGSSDFIEATLEWRRYNNNHSPDGQIGDVKTIGGAAPKAGWIHADGFALSRIKYKELFVEYGTTYGIGDGSTTFNLPNTSGRVVASINDATLPAGQNGSYLERNRGDGTSPEVGVESHSFSHVHEFDHTHTVDNHSHEWYRVLASTIDDQTFNISTVGDITDAGSKSVAGMLSIALNSGGSPDNTGFNLNGVSGVNPRTGGAILLGTSSPDVTDETDSALGGFGADNNLPPTLFMPMVVKARDD